MKNFKTLFIILGSLLILGLEGLLIWTIWDISHNPQFDYGLKVVMWICPIIFPIFCIVVLYVKAREGEREGLW